MSLLCHTTRAGWTRTRLKWLIEGSRNGAWGGEAGADQIDAICVRVADFNWAQLSLQLDDPTTRSFKRSQIDSLRLKPGDVLLEKSGGGEKTPVGRVVRFDSNLVAVTSNFVARVRPQENVCSQYLLYLLAAHYVSGYSHQFIKQNTGIQNLDDKALFSSMVSIPDLDTQRQIADFLDRETARIDLLIEKRSRFIELLKEKRQALITQAVTKGLDPGVPMNDSGVEWIGEVPAHWNTSKIRHVAKLESGHTPSRKVPAYWENCTVPWFTLADIWQVRKQGRQLIEDTNEYVSELGLANSSARKLPVNTVVLSRTASVGFPAILSRVMAVSQDFAAWICSPKLNHQYLYWSLQAMRRELDRLTMGSTHKTIYMPDIAELLCPLPPIEEQVKIVHMVESSVRKLDQVAEKTVASIELLKERRSALITAAVTGQIDLRGHAA